MKIIKVKPRKEYYNSWRRWAYVIKSKDLMKNYWYNSCSKVIIPSILNFEPACISPIKQEMISPTFYQSSSSKDTTSEIFILSWYAK